MKKTVIVNINGIIFHIDEDAYGVLSAYLDALHRYFDSQTEGKEIVSDIESRIAELLQPLISDTKQSITLDDIEKITATLGKPEDIAGEENVAKEEKKEPKQTYRASHGYSRKLYRDTDNSVIGGVCSGIAAYFDVDPVIIRILFVALVVAGGVSIIVYPILWLVVPEAQTAAQKLEMRGENVTINNIEREYHAADRTDPNSFWGKTRSGMNDLFSIFGKVVYAIWRVCAFLIGIFLIFISLTVIITLIAATFFNKFYIDFIASSSAISIKEFLECMFSPNETLWLIIFSLLVILIPLVGLIYAGLKLIIRFKARDKWAILSMFLLWIASVIILSILVFTQVNNFRLPGYAKETDSLTVPKHNTLYLNMPFSQENDEMYRMHIPPTGMFGIKIKDHKKDLWGIARVEVEKTTNATPELEIIREARGFSFDEANEAAKQIKITYVQTDSLLTLDPAFWLTQDKWKFQRVRIILRLPVNMKIIFNDNTRKFLENGWRKDYFGKTMLMLDDGLRTDYVANSMSSFNKVITVKMSPSLNPKFDSILRKNKSPKIQIVTDSGKYVLERPLITFKAWGLDNIRCYLRTSSIGRSKHNYKFKYDDDENTIYLPTYVYSTSNSSGQRFRSGLEINIPEGARLYFTKEVTDYLQYNDKHMVGGTWQITNKGFTEIPKK